MNRIKLSVFAVLVFLGAGEVSQAQVMDPAYGFPFGYTLGAQYWLRNRLPAPPYFSVYSPVYYGKRYARPYGDSPYASFPLLGQVPGYVPVPAGNSAATSRIISNPHSPCCNDSKSGDAPSDAKVTVVAQQEPGSPKVIINPYAQEQVANKD